MPVNSALTSNVDVASAGFSPESSNLRMNGQRGHFKQEQLRRSTAPALFQVVRTCRSVQLPLRGYAAAQAARRALEPFCMPRSADITHCGGHDLLPHGDRVRGLSGRSSRTHRRSAA